MRSSSTIRSRRSMTALRRSVGNVLSGGLLADGGLRCGRGGVASCACVCCGLVVFGTEGATGLACSACFGGGLAVFDVGGGGGGCGIAPPVLGAWFTIRVLAGNRPCARVAGCDVMRARSTLGAVCHINRG